MMVISDLGETLMIHSFDAKMILLKIWFLLIISLTTLEVSGVSVFSWRYRMPVIFK